MNIVKQEQYKTGFAFSGGGARAFAHLGVVQAFKEQGIMPDIISGVSGGAIVGALLADGYEPAELIEIFGKMTFKEFTGLVVPHLGLFNTKRLQALLKEYLRAQCFEDLKIPLIIIASDFDNGKAVAFFKGPLCETVAASCSLPVLFEPTLINGIHYVDGGLFKNFPVSAIRKEVKTLIGVNVNPASLQKTKKNIKGVVERCIYFAIAANMSEDDALCDILIKPEKLGTYSIFDLKKAKEIYNIGYLAGKKSIKEYVKLPFS